MWITKRTDYATRAVLALALAEGDRAVKLDELARLTEVPASVLEQVMPALRTAGIVRSERGAHGGYRLNKGPAEITLERGRLRGRLGQAGARPPLASSWPKDVGKC